MPGSIPLLYQVWLRNLEHNELINDACSKQSFKGQAGCDKTTWWSSVQHVIAGPWNLPFQYRNSPYKIRRLWDHLTFIMGIPMSEKTVFILKQEFLHSLPGRGNILCYNHSTCHTPHDIQPRNPAMPLLLQLLNCLQWRHSPLPVIRKIIHKIR